MDDYSTQLTVSGDRKYAASRFCYKFEKLKEDTSAYSTTCWHLTKCCHLAVFLSRSKTVSKNFRAMTQIL